MLRMASRPKCPSSSTRLTALYTKFPLFEAVSVRFCVHAGGSMAGELTFQLVRFSGGRSNRTPNLLIKSKPAWLHMFHLPHIFHGLAPIRGFCFRSKKNPFSVSEIDFWNILSTVR